MERLTYRGERDWEIKGADGSPCDEVCENRFLSGCHDCPIQTAFDRLAAYEDIGLMPDEIDSVFINSVMEENKRLKELAQAEQDGRLVVLPCKDDIVYTIEEDYFNCGECRHGDSAHYQAKINRISCDMNNGVHCPFYVKEHKVDGFYVKFDASGSVVLSNPGEFGYEGLEQFCGIDGKVYYTREEAEAALKKREEEANEAD